MKTLGCPSLCWELFGFGATICHSSGSAKRDMSCMTPTRAVDHIKINRVPGTTRLLLALLILALGIQACDLPGPAPAAGTATPAPQVTSQPTAQPAQSPTLISTPQLLGDAKVNS